MDFSIPAPLAQQLNDVDAIVNEHIIPIEELVFTQGFSVALSDLAAIRKIVKERGLWAPNLPTSLGGMGLGLVAHGLISERLAPGPLCIRMSGARRWQRRDLASARHRRAARSVARTVGAR